MLALTSISFHLIPDSLQLEEQMFVLALASSPFPLTPYSLQLEQQMQVLALASISLSLIPYSPGCGASCASTSVHAGSGSQWLCVAERDCLHHTYNAGSKGVVFLF